MLEENSVAELVKVFKLVWVSVVMPLVGKGEVFEVYSVAEFLGVVDINSVVGLEKVSGVNSLAVSKVVLKFTYGSKSLENFKAFCEFRENFLRFWWFLEKFFRFEIFSMAIGLLPLLVELPNFEGLLEGMLSKLSLVGFFRLFCRFWDIFLFFSFFWLKFSEICEILSFFCEKSVKFEVSANSGSISKSVEVKLFLSEFENGSKGGSG